MRQSPGSATPSTTSVKATVGASSNSGDVKITTSPFGAVKLKSVADRTAQSSQQPPAKSADEQPQIFVQLRKTPGGVNTGKTGTSTSTGANTVGTGTGNSNPNSPSSNAIPHVALKAVNKATPTGTPAQNPTPSHTWSPSQRTSATTSGAQRSHSMSLGATSRPGSLDSICRAKPNLQLNSDHRTAHSPISPQSQQTAEQAHAHATPPSRDLLQSAQVQPETVAREKNDSVLPIQSGQELVDPVLPSQPVPVVQVPTEAPQEASKPLSQQEQNQSNKQDTGPLVLTPSVASLNTMQSDPHTLAPSTPPMDQGNEIAKATNQVGGNTSNSSPTPQHGTPPAHHAPPSTIRTGPPPKHAPAAPRLAAGPPKLFTRTQSLDRVSPPSSYFDYSSEYSLQSSAPVNSPVAHPIPLEQELGGTESSEQPSLPPTNTDAPPAEPPPFIGPPIVPPPMIQPPVDLPSTILAEVSHSAVPFVEPLVIGPPSIGPPAIEPLVTVPHPEDQPLFVPPPCDVPPPIGPPEVTPATTILPPQSTPASMPVFVPPPPILPPPSDTSSIGPPPVTTPAPETIVSFNISSLGEWVSSVTPEEMPKLQDMLAKRSKIAGEILSTEETYTNQLNTVVGRFIDQLKAVPRGITKEDIFHIFSNMEVIRDCHERLLSAIEARLATWEGNSVIGDIFLNETAWIKLYKHYVNNYGPSLIVLKECKEKAPLFKKYLEHLDYSSSLFGLNLEGLLITPVQRIPRYVLLLNDMLRSTPKAHPDHSLLSGALNFIRELADYINENKHDAESVAQLCDIQAKWIDYPSNLKLASQPKRKFVKEGAAVVNKKKKHLWLFSDIFVLTKVADKTGKYTYEQSINLSTSSLQSGTTPQTFGMICTDGMYKYNFTTPQEAQDWTKSINGALHSARECMIASAFVDTVQSASEGSKSYASLVAAENEKKCQETLIKLAETELEYLNGLKLAFEVFVIPIRNSPAVDSLTGNILFTTFEKLISEHSKISVALQQKLATYDSNTTITDIFDAALLDIYSNYFTNYPNQVVALDTAMNDGPFAGWQLTTEKTRKLEMKTELEKPLRRISTYYLLAQEMMHYTNKKSPHIEPLKRLVSQLSLATEDLKKQTTEAATRLAKKRGKP
ncbi:Guanine exchange factor for Rac 30 [Pelomyxa schiedti]|nr:Guanine exchange factor for Rac 30 [Pelomyxa schiedti]